VLGEDIERRKVVERREARESGKWKEQSGKCG
jgi:hypothetical protein